MYRRFDAHALKRRGMEITQWTDNSALSLNPSSEKRLPGVGKHVDPFSVSYDTREEHYRRGLLRRRRFVIDRNRIREECHIHLRQCGR